MKRIKIEFLIFFKRIILYIINVYSSKQVYYIMEAANWATKVVAQNILENIKEIDYKLTSYAGGIRNAVVHYGSFHAFANDNYAKRAKYNKIIVTCFHIVDNNEAYANIKNLDQYVDIWHTSCEITKRKLLNMGVDEEKIVLIPIPVNNNIHHKIDEEKREKKIRELHIPDRTFVIGSFQKDGNGWEEGMEPKLIKGPDIFCDVLERLSENHNIFVVLSGPARGYVKKRLDDAGIPYIHQYFDDFRAVAELYGVIDLYMVTSREEGGPMSILESMSSGVPVISSKVGMAPDIIENGANGYLVEIGDVEQYVQCAEKIIKNREKTAEMIKAGFETAKKYTAVIAAQKYTEVMYHKLVK